MSAANIVQGTEVCANPVVRTRTDKASANDSERLAQEGGLGGITNPAQGIGVQKQG